MPDPTVVIPAYFSHPDVQAIESEMLEAAQNAHKKVPSKVQMSKFTNFMAVRLMIKNPSRKEVLGNMTRAEYLTGRNDKIKEYPYKDDGSAQRKNVYNLGEGIGEHRIVEADADEGTYPDEQQGIIIRTEKHKSFATSGAAITFLSLVDGMLMDAY